jgi:hypothetical protein
VIMNHNMHLAPELIDLILDNLHERLWDVRCCSLVCRAWLHKCRSLLFRHTVLYPPGPQHTITTFIQLCLIPLTS